MISNSYWLEISRDLEPHHALFYQCWQMGKPKFTEEVDTAAVSFNKNGECIDFMFNPHYWNYLNHYERLFVICHECLHIVLNHGSRTRNANDSDRVNKALDIAVNTMLINGFGFERSKIRDADGLCWVDTVFADFPNLKKIPLNESFEYYYKITPKTSKPKTLDDHSKMSNWNKVIDKLNNVLSNQEKKAIKSLIGSASGKWTIVNVEHSIKRKWETIITRWSLKYLKNDLELKEQWTRINRRLFGLNDLILPSEMEDDMIDKDRLPVMFFLDTSGSCWSLRERFFNAAASLPKDKFVVRLFCYDTEVKETTFESKKAYGGGGTKFSIIESYIQSVIKKENIDYPEAIFVITDGYGDVVLPQKPQNWHWLLTSFGSQKFIPAKSKIYQLKDFE